MVIFICCENKLRNPYRTISEYCYLLINFLTLVPLSVVKEIR